MDLDDLFARRPTDPLTLMARQDLDPFSVAELEERLEVLEAEITRVKAKMTAASRFKDHASSLFKT